MEGDGLKNLLTILEPEYKIPCRKTISSRIKYLYNDKLEKVKTALDSASDIALTTDCWTSRATRSYMGLTSHYLDSEWINHSFNLLTEELTESHTAENLEDALREGMEEWNITEKVRTVVHDNARNITNAVQNLKRDSIDSHPCTAHTLQLSVNLGLKLPECAGIMEKVSKLVSCFNQSTKRTYALEKHLTQTESPVKKLIQSCPTRWNSGLFMIERIKELRPSIVAVISDRSIFDKRVAQRIAISENEWESIDTLINLLTPFQIATTVLSSDTEITISKVEPIVHKLINKHLQLKYNDTRLSKAFKKTVVADLKRRFYFENSEDPNLQEIRTTHVASFLDPRFKQLKFLENNNFRQTVIDHVKELCKQINVSDTNDPETLMKKHNLTAMDMLLDDDSESDTSGDDDEFQRYVSEEQINYNLSANSWWKEHKKIYPTISQLAKRYLAVPATSTASERVFSSAGNIVRPSRNCLGSEMVSALVFLHQNKKLTNAK